MMMWVLLICAALIAAPLIIEATRKPTNAARRSAAPGSFVDLPQGMTHFKWTGPEQGRVVVCIHGLTTPSFVWRQIEQDLAQQGFRVLTYDHFGRGFSDRIGGAQNRAFFLRHLHDVLESQKIDQDVTLIGYSMGGAIATAYAAQNPNSTRQVVLLAPAGARPVIGSTLGRLIALPVIGTWIILACYPEMLRKGLRAEADHPTSVPGINQLQNQELDYRGFLPAVARSLRGILSESFQADHQALRHAAIPVMTIWGADDAVIPISSKDILSEWNPDMLHHVIEQTGHNVPYAQHETVMGHITPFLQADD
ncbi:MAG: alpha/beta fold hydrolase [Roseobacter sp.]